MEEADSLTRLQGLQADLAAFSESRLANLERLWAELEGSIEDFRNLLDKERKDGKSRQELSASTSFSSQNRIGAAADTAIDTIKLGDVEYSINDDFRQDVIQVADELDLAELEAARLYLNSQEAAQELDRPPALAAIFRFHGERETLLECLRLSLQQAVDFDRDPEERGMFAELARLVVRGEQGSNNSGSAYWRKCVTSMEDIEQWLGRIQARLAGDSALGQILAGYALESLEFQRLSLTRQHESLGAILCHLVKDGQATIDDYRFLLGKTASLDKLDELVLHYVPLLISCATCFGPADSSASLREARGLDQVFADASDQSQWKLKDFRAATIAWWLAEYNGRYIDNPVGSPLQGVNLEAENEKRSERFMTSLRDGAFEFMLLLSSKVRLEQWYDPAKAGLLQYLLGSSDRTQTLKMVASEYFQELLSEHLQAFVDAFITNMPDTIRKLKAEEDEHRRNRLPQVPQDASSTQDVDLERFLLLISYSFQGFPEAAQAFWSDPDGNLYGFLQWASKRLPTPRVAAFCEMFRSIAENEESAEAAHKFLLEETTASSARLKRGRSIGWAQILDELHFYATLDKDKPALSSFSLDSRASPEVLEPESAIMLESYLRLVSHLCRTSPSARDYLLLHPTVPMHSILFELANTGIDNRLKACIFNTLASLLTDKVSEVNDAMWDALDRWIFSNPQSPQMKPNPAQRNAEYDDVMLQSVTVGFEDSTAFVGFLHALASPIATQSALGDNLPFPEQLGAAYRMPGIDKYIDIALGKVFAKPIEGQDEDLTWEQRCVCLNLITTCLSNFNEDLVIFANSTSISVDSAISTSTLAAYVKLHPFARVMEWLFNDAVITALFASAHETVEVVGACAPGSPKLLALCRSIEVISSVLSLQSTYFDLVRPLVKTQSATRSRNVANPALASFEDAILTKVDLVVDLGLYCGTGHQDLTILSLQLLEKLATSRKLTIAPGNASIGRQTGNRVLTALQQNADADRVSAAFIAPMRLDPRELEMGEIAPGFAIKQAILDLLNSSLKTSPNRPALAHCLLGFECADRTLTVPPTGLFASGASLFHAVVRLSAEVMALEKVNAYPWLSRIRRGACDIIRKLIRSSLTGGLILDELRDSGYFEAVALAQRPITTNTLWCGKAFTDPEFLLGDSAFVFRDFLEQRTSFFEHAALALRSTVESNSPTARRKLLSSLLGVTILPTSEQVSSPSMFEMFDFVDLDVSPPFQLPSRQYFSNIDFSVCRQSSEEPIQVYDMKLVKELLLLGEADLKKRGQIADAIAEQQCHTEADTILLCLQSENQYAAVSTAQTYTLNAWAQLVTLMLTNNDFEPAAKTAFVLQALQIILPKFDRNIAEDLPTTLSLAKLTHTLVRAVDLGLVGQTSKEGNVTNERLLHTFRTSLRGLSSATADVRLRETCYHIARHFIKTTNMVPGGQAMLRRQSIKIIDNAGERLMETISEDALSSQGTCRISAILLLEACVQLFQASKTSPVVHALTRLNFIAVLVDSIRGIAPEFQQQRTGQGQFLPFVLQPTSADRRSRFTNPTLVHPRKSSSTFALITNK